MHSHATESHCQRESLSPPWWILKQKKESDGWLKSAQQCHREPLPVTESLLHYEFLSSEWWLVKKKYSHVNVCQSGLAHLSKAWILVLTDMLTHALETTWTQSQHDRFHLSLSTGSYWIRLRAYIHNVLLVRNWVKQLQNQNLKTEFASSASHSFTCPRFAH